MKLTPLHTLSQEHGAEFVEISGWRFAKNYASVEAEMAVPRERVGLADVRPHGKLFIEGAAAHAALVATYAAAPEMIGTHVGLTDGGLYRLRHDQFYLSTSPGREAQAQARLEATIRAQNLFVTI